MSNPMPNRQSWPGPRPGDYLLGSVQSRAAAREVQLAREVEAQERRAALLRNATPLELIMMEMAGAPEGPSLVLHMLTEAMIDKCKLLGMPPPTPEQMRHKCQVAEEVDRLKQEPKTASLNDNELREMAEERLQRKGRGPTSNGIGM
jgi:hypothetical protein